MPLSNRVIALILRNDAMITNLNLSNMNLEDQDLEDLAKLLGDNSYIKTLDLSDNEITSEGAESLCSCIHITGINIANNRLQDAGARILIKHPALLSLNMNRNGLSDEVIKELRANKPSYMQLEPHQTKEEYENSRISTLERIASMHTPPQLFHQRFKKDDKDDEAEPKTKCLTKGGCNIL